MKDRIWFSQWWIWVILVGLNALSWYAAYQQIVLEQPFGNNPMSDTGLFVLIGFVTLFSLFFLFMRLEAEINKEGIYVRFYPFHLQYRFSLGMKRRRFMFGSIPQSWSMVAGDYDIVSLKEGPGICLEIWAFKSF